MRVVGEAQMGKAFGWRSWRRARDTSGQPSPTAEKVRKLQLIAGAKRSYRT